MPRRMTVCVSDWCHPLIVARGSRTLEMCQTNTLISLDSIAQLVDQQSRNPNLRVRTRLSQPYYWADLINVVSWGRKGQFAPPDGWKRTKSERKWEETGRKTERRGSVQGRKMRMREKHEDVNGKMLGMEVKHCIHRDINYGVWLLDMGCQHQMRRNL